MKLTCTCCGIEREFKNAQEAFEAGWDEPVHLPGWPVSCDLCPGVCAMGWASHTKAHAHWAKHGRPAEFNSLCYDDKLFPMDAANETRHVLGNDAGPVNGGRLEEKPQS